MGWQSINILPWLSVCWQFGQQVVVLSTQFTSRDYSNFLCLLKMRLFCSFSFAFSCQSTYCSTKLGVISRPISILCSISPSCKPRKLQLDCKIYEWKCNNSSPLGILHILCARVLCALLTKLICFGGKPTWHICFNYCKERKANKINPGVPTGFIMELPSILLDKSNTSNVYLH